MENPEEEVAGAETGTVVFVHVEVVDPRVEVVKGKEAPIAGIVLPAEPSVKLLGAPVTVPIVVGKVIDVPPFGGTSVTNKENTCGIFQ